MQSKHVMTVYPLYHLRKKWFNLKTKEFIKRNIAGFLVLVVFLPGVAIGANFKVFISAISQPFLIVVSVDEAFFIKLIWLTVLSVVFTVWSRAQRLAISGGDFADYMQSLPISNTIKNKTNIKMLLKSNHILWFFIFASFYFLIKIPQTQIVAFFNFGFLLSFLLTTQFVSVFKPKNKFFMTLFLMAFVFITPLPIGLMWLRLLVLSFVLIKLIQGVLDTTERKFEFAQSSPPRLIPNFISANLYVEILFKSGLTSTLFRLSIVFAIIVGFLISANHFIETSNNDLIPFAYVLEALIAYYLSGFFVTFIDERKCMQALFASLPLKHYFWLIRDSFAVLIISLVIHALYFIWAKYYFSSEALLTLLLFHLLLLLICYPLRILVKNNQTFISFVVLFIITAVTLYNLS